MGVFSRLFGSRAHELSGTIEMMVPGGDELLVVYVCPKCCHGDQRISSRLSSETGSFITKKKFANGVLRAGRVNIDCPNCDTPLSLEADDGARQMLRAARSMGQV